MCVFASTCMLLLMVVEMAMFLLLLQAHVGSFPFYTSGWGYV
jgi:hypothetical protein